MTGPSDIRQRKLTGNPMDLAVDSELAHQYVVSFYVIGQIRQVTGRLQHNDREPQDSYPER